MLDDPKVISALISAVVSITVASVSGLYILFKTKREIENIQRKTIAEKHTERFLDDATEYRNAYKIYGSKKRELHFELEKLGDDADSTPFTQHIFDFYAASKEYYRDNEYFLKSNKLEKNFREVQLLIDSGTFNDHANPNRMENIHQACKVSIEIFELLYKKSLK